MLARLQQIHLLHDVIFMLQMICGRGNERWGVAERSDLVIYLDALCNVCVCSVYHVQMVNVFSLVLYRYNWLTDKPLFIGNLVER